MSPDGSGLFQVVSGHREHAAEDPFRVQAPNWNATPAFSPDGSRLLFTRDFDIYVADADGSDIRLLADVGNWDPLWGASNPSLGAQSAAWSPDGQSIMYVLSRIGGSGITRVWAMRADGSERRLIYREDALSLVPTWLDDNRIAFLHGRVAAPTYYWPEGPQEAPVPRSAERRLKVAVYGWPEGVEQESLLLPDLGYQGLFQAGPNSAWLVGSFTDERPIFYGTPSGFTRIGHGVSPTLSLDGGWIAYFQGDSLRLAKVDGSEDREVVDLAPLGGRDRHFASGCGPTLGRLPGCGHRPPVISWR